MAQRSPSAIPAFLMSNFAMPESWVAAARYSANWSDAVDAFFLNGMKRTGSAAPARHLRASVNHRYRHEQNTKRNEIVPWLQLLSRNAFAITDAAARVTLTLRMAKYLDLANQREARRCRRRE